MPNLDISRASRVEAIVRAARRRKLLVVTVEQLALAVAIVLGGGIFMLLLGTEILSPYWLALLGVVGVILAISRIRARMPGPYRIAQLLDHRLQLSDTLSTAWFLLAHRDRATNRVADLQLTRAEEIAASVRPASAFPFAGQRIWTLAAALAAVAFGLFALRYLVTNSLSIRQALVPIHLGSVFEWAQRSFSPGSHPLAETAALNRMDARSTDASDSSRQMENQQLASEEFNAGKSEDSSLNGSAADSQKSDPQDAKTPQPGKGESREGGQSSGQTSEGQKFNQEAGDQTKAQQSPTTKEQPDNSQQPSSGLVDKMKDALSSLMSKVKPNATSQRPNQNGDRAQEDKGSDQSSATQDQKGQSQQNARSEQSSQEQSAEGEAQGQTTERAQASQGRSSDQSADKKNSDAHSGVGRQDGDKDIKEAEQLKAMGKLAEIIGKRSANLTGEMMVETPTGKQQLKTEYSQRLGHHTDLGGEINRDEIPLMYQQYIREYMEQVRKQGKVQ